MVRGPLPPTGVEEKLLQLFKRPLMQRRVVWLANCLAADTVQLANKKGAIGEPQECFCFPFHKGKTL